MVPLPTYAVQCTSAKASLRGMRVSEQFGGRGQVAMWTMRINGYPFSSAKVWWHFHRFGPNYECIPRPYTPGAPAKTARGR